MQLNNLAICGVYCKTTCFVFICVFVICQWFCLAVFFVFFAIFLFFAIFHFFYRDFGCDVVFVFCLVLQLPCGVIVDRIVKPVGFHSYVCHPIYDLPKGVEHGVGMVDDVFNVLIV